MEKLISIVGLTSSGKSGLGIELARFFDGEIVSADSRQVYKGLDWCSGKVNEEELAMAKHHLIDIANLGEQFTLFDFQREAYKAIDDIISRKKVPFMVGGTGLYSRSIVEGFDLTEDKPNIELREKLEKLSKDELLKMCEEKNIELPDEITSRRLIRAIEKAESPKKENKPRYEVLQIGIDWSKEEIHERIRTRLEFRIHRHSVFKLGHSFDLRSAPFRHIGPDQSLSQWRTHRIPTPGNLVTLLVLPACPVPVDDVVRREPHCIVQLTGL